MPSTGLTVRVNPTTRSGAPAVLETGGAAPFWGRFD
jgi:hypothetical protein